MTDEPELPEAETLAAEHALGVLNGGERAAAELRMARDPVFAALVAEWRARLHPLIAEVAAISPPHGLWPRIERALPSNDNAVVLRHLRLWRGATIGSLGLAAAAMVAAVVLGVRPPVTVPTANPAPILNASLTTPEGAKPLFVAAYDPGRNALIITSLAPPGTDPVHVHQLWLITPEAKPRSLGLIEPGKSKVLPMPANLDKAFAEGAALAVSVEPPGGSPKPDAPSGPIAAMGKLTRL
jgi:anti-sigma-K factor RskA